MLKRVYISVDQLQDDLDKFICYYNFKRANQGYWLKGKISYRKFIDSRCKLA